MRAKPAEAPAYRGFWGILLSCASFGSVGVLLVVLFLLMFTPELGLKILWYGIIPLAPLIFFTVPNVWVNLCPLQIIQSFPRRMGMSGTRVLPPATQLMFMQGSWVLLYLLVPLRHFVFNEMAMVCLVTTLLLGIVAFSSGLVFKGLGGWCSALCPIRPVEMAYGLFAKENHRPEVCATCESCLDGCPRKSAGNFTGKRQFNAKFVSWLYSFPGFVLGYFLVSKDDGLLLVYGTVFGLAIASLMLFSALDRLVKWRRTLEAAILTAFTTYYVFIIPKILAQWGLL